MHFSKMADQNIKQDIQSDTYEEMADQLRPVHCKLLFVIEWPLSSFSLQVL